MNFHFTFGYGTPYRNNYVKIDAEEPEAAREQMVRLYGQKWAFQYTEETFKGQPEQFGLTELAKGMPSL